MYKDVLNIKEVEEVSQYITKDKRQGIQGIIFVDHAQFENDLETLLHAHITRKKQWLKQIQLDLFIVYDIIIPEINNIRGETNKGTGKIYYMGGMVK